MGINADTVFIGMEDARLKGAEEATTARDSQHHAAELGRRVCDPAGRQRWHRDVRIDVGAIPKFG
jgi:hypothetical protein